MVIAYAGLGFAFRMGPVGHPVSRLGALMAHDTSRRDLLFRGLVATPAALVFPQQSSALVKGSAPPPKKEKRAERTCTSIDDCEAVGEKRYLEEFAKANDEDVQRTASGDRFKDIVVGSGPEVGKDTEVTLKYRVLRLGKRSTDGLSGEASPVFSLGHGEDDDTEKDSITFSMAQGNVVLALDEGLLGMREGGIRRINVRPERGWKLPDSSCLKTYTDVTIVPGTQVIQSNSACSQRLV